MAVCEYHKEYTEFLNKRIESELTKDDLKGRVGWSEVWSVVQNTAICLLLQNISEGEADSVYRAVFNLYPQFEEKVKLELQSKHLVN